MSVIKHEGETPTEEEVEKFHAYIERCVAAMKFDIAMEIVEEENDNTK